MTGQSPEVVVVGGGVFGAAIAYFLTEHRVGAVWLLEREHVASGATGASSAIVRVHYTNPYEAHLALTSLEVFRHWADRIGGACGYRRTGFLRIVGTHDRDHLRRNVGMLRSLGADVTFVEPGDLHELQPSLSSDDVGGAAYEPDGGFADGTDTANALVGQAIARGAALHTGVTVTALRLAGDRVVGVETSLGFIPAGAVVVAAGAWSMALLRRAGIELPLRSRLIRAGLLEHAADHQAEHMTVIDDSVGTYFKPERRDRTEFGLRYQWDADPVHGTPPVSLDYIADGAGHLVGRVPALAHAGMVRGWAATDGFSADRIPLLGAIPSVQGLYVAVGASGSGFKIAPAVGMGIAEVVALGRGRSVDLTPLRPTRFADGEPIQSPTEYRRPGWRDEPIGRQEDSGGSPRNSQSGTA